ncbi:winged helix-turn-helix domain-containing protein [Paenibacillus sp.]|uniref:ArsR/SmtB family transcription factor n=1 Tax=Paenibacillus sp. TaxID=58172 RepID=UPI002D731FB1|nr:winged helix-turn-helix domain-containing protein [Paenibacillus sp.]HZG58432.1 winged helix-turn-helix domain-containing protein [Paenibacillus sp.]
MSYRVQFEYSPVYELLLSFMIYSRRKWTRNLDIGTAWLKETDDLFGAKRKAASAACTEDTFDRLFLLAYLCPDKEDVPRFLDWLSALSPGQLYELLSPQTLGSMPSDLGGDIERAVTLLRAWHELYFEAFNQGWDATARASLADQTAAPAADPVSQVELTTGGLVLEPNDRIQTITLVPAQHFRPLNLYAIYRSLVIILYPVDPPAEPDAPPTMLLRATRAMSDESRLRILRFLAPEARSFTEVVAYTGLSKGTVHHHMMALRAAGLIRTHLVGEQYQHERFSIRLDGVEECTESLRTYMKS